MMPLLWIEQIPVRPRRRRVYHPGVQPSRQKLAGSGRGEFDFLVWPPGAKLPACAGGANPSFNFTRAGATRKILSGSEFIENRFFEPAHGMSLGAIVSRTTSRFAPSLQASSLGISRLRRADVPVTPRQWRSPTKSTLAPAAATPETYAGLFQVSYRARGGCGGARVACQTAIWHSSCHPTADYKLPSP